ncbi:MAG: anti-phage BREX system Lon protease BrxL [Prevotella sp.]|nr:anti-phage BREX system Lon protease BrxL [Prevotella sp.]
MALPDSDKVIQELNRRFAAPLSKFYARPDEAQKVLSKLRQRGSHTIIDMVTVDLNLRYDEYEASFSNLVLSGIPISEDYPERYDRMLCGGIWCI